MMTASSRAKLKVLITVKTYPIPSKRYDELVCTAGVTERGDFIRLYPINVAIVNAVFTIGLSWGPYERRDDV